MPRITKISRPPKVAARWRSIFFALVRDVCLFWGDFLPGEGGVFDVLPFLTVFSVFALARGFRAFWAGLVFFEGSFRGMFKL